MAIRVFFEKWTSIYNSSARLCADCSSVPLIISTSLFFVTEEKTRPVRTRQKLARKRADIVSIMINLQSVRDSRYTHAARGPKEGRKKGTGRRSRHIPPFDRLTTSSNTSSRIINAPESDRCFRNGERDKERSGWQKSWPLQPVSRCNKIENDFLRFKTNTQSDFHRHARRVNILCTRYVRSIIYAILV